MKHLVLHSLLILCTWAGLGAERASSRATPKPPTPPSNAQRFLFIVNTSASMRRLEHDGRQALFDMIYTGLDGYMQTGDTYGLWTFNDQITAGAFPMQGWNTNQLLSLASRATLFVKEQPYSGKKPCLEGVVTAAQSVLRVVEDLNILIISDETPHLQGTPFDDLVNGLYEKFADEVHRTGKPIVTSIVARDGLLANATVTLAGERIFLPPRPELVPPPAPAASQAKQSPAKPRTTLHADNSVPTPNQTQENSSRTIIITAQQKETKPGARSFAEPSPTVLPPTDPVPKVDQAHQSETPTPRQPDSPVLQAETSRSSLVATGTAAHSQTPIPAVPELPGLPQEYPTPLSPSASSAPSQTTPIPNSETARHDPPPGLPRIDSALATLGSAPRTVAAREPASAASLPPDQTRPETFALTGLAAPPVPSKTRVLIWLTAGIGFLVLAVSLAVVFWKLHRNAFQPSVITQSMEKR
jgi:hypothetical protein